VYDIIIIIYRCCWCSQPDANVSETA